MTAAGAAPAAPAARLGYDQDAEATARRVQPMLASGRVAWLSTVRPDGRPHLVPAWFWWDGEAVLVWSKPEAVKVRNLRANPRLMLAVGDATADFAVGLVEARAELADVPVPDAFFAKYAGELAAGRLDPGLFRATYTQAIRIEPAHVLAWRGRGARHAAAAAPRPAGVAVRLASLLDRVASQVAARVASQVRPQAAGPRPAPTPATAAAG